MNLSNLLHAVAAVAIQIAVWLVSGSWTAGAIAGTLVFVSREVTQAEYRWIAAFGYGSRANMPWWGGFSPRVWSRDALLDAVSPAVAVTAVALIMEGRHAS